VLAKKGLTRESTRQPTSMVFQLTKTNTMIPKISSTLSWWLWMGMKKREKEKEGEGERLLEELFDPM